MPGRCNIYIVVITGGCSRIGAALAQKFYKRGCHLILIGNDINRLDEIKLYLSSLHSQYPTHTPIAMQINLSELDNVQNHVESIVNLYGHIDILINNANINFIGEVINTAICTDMEIMTNNYFSQIALTKAVLRYMLSNISGHIVFVSSSQGICTDPLYSSFGASQHALLIFANTLREEIQETNIKVTTICIPKMHTQNIDENLGIDGDDKRDSNLSKTTASEVIKAIEHEKLDVIIEPFYRKISFFIKGLWPNLHYTLFRSKF
ncbi:dehydrogenase/reductase SDR family protein 7-like isoform X2 [Arctopsyche grandis]|uniref:dehydrogenase/reductase SDR family protein 7-like isoform X2 n=1 Tax=Arctopsyche grandis TaxID=121162 RepID=UPI00406D6BCF